MSLSGFCLVLTVSVLNPLPPVPVVSSIHFTNVSASLRISRSEVCKIFVGGLAQEVTDKDFYEYFGEFGTVKDAIVMVDRNTGSSRGFGFVTFEREDAVDRVMKQDHELQGKRIEIKRAEPRDGG